MSYRVIPLNVLFLLCINAFSQSESPKKQITSYNQSWFSINSTLRFSDKWGMVADFHIRRDDFISEPYFYFVRAGVSYWISGKYPVILGVGHMWNAPSEGSSTWSDENRIYQQWSAIQKQGIVSVLHRIRLEERWKEQIVNDEVAPDRLFTIRLRYLASFDIRPFTNPKIPGLVISDEVLVQFGKSIVYNTFDQNRLFIGLKESMSKELSFDIGYMTILQEKSSGYQYSMSNLFRLFFYYNVNFNERRNNAGAHNNS